MNHRRILAWAGLIATVVVLGIVAVGHRPTASAAAIAHTSCPGQGAPVSTGSVSYTCSSEGVVTNGGKSAYVRQVLVVNASGSATVTFSLPHGALPFAVGLQWSSHDRLSGEGFASHTVTGSIPAGSTTVVLSNVLVGCGGQQDIKAVPNGQTSITHIDKKYRLAGPVVYQPQCFAPPVTTTTTPHVPTTTTPPAATTTTPRSSTTVPAVNTLPPGSLPATR